jgi:maleate isomerase
MPDALGWRSKFGLITPAWNTVFEPECERMRPRGVTNQTMRVAIPDTPVASEEEFASVVQTVRTALETALDTILTCEPACVIFGMAAETFWEGLLEPAALRAQLEARSRVNVILGTQACLAALKRYAGSRRISLITPYKPSGDAQVRRLFTSNGYEVVNLLSLQSENPLLIAHESPQRLRRAVKEVDDPSVEAIVQMGCNLPFAHVASEAERWLDKPVLAINTCTYWYALRQCGIDDKIEGLGSLLAEH